MTSLAMMATGGGIPIRQTKFAPDGVKFCEDVSEGRWVEKHLSDSGMSTVSSLLPNGFPAYARVFHPAYLNDDEEQPVRWSTVASWTGRTVHPLMQFQRVAGLPEGPHFNTPDPPWGSHPTVGSIPEAECRTLFETLRGFTTTPDICYFCLWEGWGNIDIRLYKAGSRVRAPHRDHLLFRGMVGVCKLGSRLSIMFWVGRRTMEATGQTWESTGWNAIRRTTSSFRAGATGFGTVRNGASPSRSGNREPANAYRT